MDGLHFDLCRLEEKMAASCEHLTKVGLEEKEKRDKELASYREATREACLTNQQLSVQKVKEYEELRDKVVCVGLIVGLAAMIALYSAVRPV